MAEPVQRRDLKFESFDDVGAEVDRLHESGYTQNGNWNLAQACLHLTEWMRYPIDGYPKKSLPVRALMWMFKVTLAKGWRRKILSSGFSPGMPTDPKTAFPADQAEEAEAIEELKETIRRFVAFEGEYHPSPLFGSFDKESQQSLQLQHCAHHLGFLEPK